MCFLAAIWRLALVILLIILNHTENPTFQLAWASLVLLFPVVGGLMYLYCELQPGTALLFARITEIDRETVSMLKQERRCLQTLAGRITGWHSWQTIFRRMAILLIRTRK